MRVAVLISGQPRGFAKLAWGCFVEKVIQQSASCSFDVFLSIQDQESVQFDGKVVLRAVTAQVEQEYRAVYGSNLKASKAVLNSQSRKDRLTRFVHFPWLKQFVWLELAWEMMKEYERANRFTYDLVVRLRPDVGVRDPIDISKLDVKEYVYTAIDWMIVGLRSDMEWICTQFLNRWFTYRHPELLFQDEDTKYKWMFSVEVQISCHIRAIKNEASMMNSFKPIKTFMLFRFAPQQHIILWQGSYGRGPFWNIEASKTRQIAREKEEEWSKR